MKTSENFSLLSLSHISLYTHPQKNGTVTFPIQYVIKFIRNKIYTNINYT
jgi:hypothetical protein